jgi:hypothetical protein
MDPENTPATSANPLDSPELVAAETSPETSAPAIHRIKHLHASLTKIEDRLDDTNWVVWRELIRRIFAMCEVEPYVYGRLPCPADTWRANDMYAQVIIVSNITKGQMVHVTRLKTASEIWTSLRAIHETKDYGSAITIQRGLFALYAKEGADVIQHLSKLKKQWERLNVLDNTSFHIPDRQFNC